MPSLLRGREKTTRTITGSFQWDAVDFSKSAEEVSFSLEGDESVPILRARLLDVDGNAVSRDVNLSERISNADGQFLFCT